MEFLIKAAQKGQNVIVSYVDLFLEGCSQIFILHIRSLEKFIIGLLVVKKKQTL